MIYLYPEVKSGLGEDTFWTWFNREIPSKFINNSNIKVTDTDVILHYSTLGKSNNPNQTICLLWELYPEMKQVLKENTWDQKIQKINEAKSSSKYKVVASKLMVPYYGNKEEIDVLPIGVDCELFTPLNNKKHIQNKYNIPNNKEIGVWVGTQDKMKGWDKFIDYKNSNPNIFWIVIWKSKSSRPRNLTLNNCVEFIQVPQITLNELFNCADFFLSTSRLRPFYMVEWEAMASNLSMVILDNVEKDFRPSSEPRYQVMQLGWDRRLAKDLWIKYIEKIV